MADTQNILILGMGNVLMQDEGVGVRAVEELESRYEIPEGVTVVDGAVRADAQLRPVDCRRCGEYR